MEFADAKTISAWAVDAVNALNKEGMVKGIEGTDGKFYFQPKKVTNRAEGATMIVRVVEVLLPAE